MTTVAARIAPIASLEELDGYEREARFRGLLDGEAAALTAKRKELEARK